HDCEIGRRCRGWLLIPTLTAIPPKPVTENVIGVIHDLCVTKGPVHCALRMGSIGRCEEGQNEIKSNPEEDSQTCQISACVRPERTFWVLGANYHGTKGSA